MHLTGQVGKIQQGRLYSEYELRMFLRLTESELRAGRDSGGLRCRTIGGVRHYLGAWVIAWLTGDPAGG